MARGRSISNLHIDFQILEGTYAEFDGHGEVVDASLLGNSFTAGDTWKVDVGRFDYAFFSFNSSDNFLGKARTNQLCSYASHTLDWKDTGSLRMP